VDLTAEVLAALPAAPRDAVAAERWAASGAMGLTGRRASPALGAPRDLPILLDGLAARLHDLTARLGRAVSIDGPALLGERAALAGLERSGDVSCGGVSKLLPAADGWLAASIARAEDVELLPAWLGLPAGRDAWNAVASTVRTRPAGEMVLSGAELGLAVAELGERAGDRDAVLSVALGDQPPTATVRGLRVIDLSSLWAGPLTGQLLAAAGMDVVKVESRQRPDGARRGPAAFYDLMNGEKPAVALDFSAAADRAILRQLLRTAEVVIEASRTRALRQLGLQAEELVDEGSIRVWLSITGHGRQPPHDLRVAFGDDAAVAGGLVATDDRGPVFCADAVADPATGLLAAVAVLDRLAAGGRWLLDVALARTAALMAGGPSVAWTGPVAPPRARAVTRTAPRLGQDTARIVAELTDRR
jgi:hypothetical protein